MTGALLGLATAATYFPMFVVPIWLSFYRERGSGRVLISFFLVLGLGLGGIAWTLSRHDELELAIQLARDSTAWQWWKPASAPEYGVAPESLWTGVHWAYRIPVFLLFLSFVIATMFWPYPKNLAQVISLSAAVFIGLQWWCGEQGGVYVLWYMPLLLLQIFRPNLQDRVAVPILPDVDWLTRSLRALVRVFRRLIRLPEPVKTNIP